MLNSCLDILLEIAGFSQLCKVSWKAHVWRFSSNYLWSFAHELYKVSWKARVWRFLEMISGLSQLCKVSWKACVWRFYWNDLWSFETFQNLVKRACLEIFLKCSLVFRSYVKSRERHVFRDILENLWWFTALVSPKAPVCRFSWKSLVYHLYVMPRY